MVALVSGANLALHHYFPGVVQGLTVSEQPGYICTYLVTSEKAGKFIFLHLVTFL